MLNRYRSIIDKFMRHTFGVMKPTKGLPYEIVLPHEVDAPNTFPNHITAPLYVHNDGYEESPSEPLIKTAVEIDLMRQSCRLAKRMLNAARSRIKVGLTTDELDKYIHKLILDNMAYPSPLNYRGFPKSICTSVNNVVCHGIPDDRPLANGDIITVDITVYLQGFHGDCAATFLVGDVDQKGQFLVSSTETILLQAIEECKPGAPVTAIGHRIGFESRKLGLTVIPAVCGHGIGRHFHEEPAIIHDTGFVSSEEIEIMEPGMVFTIEPAVGDGGSGVLLLEDDWTLITDDDSRTAQFEHTVLITKDGAEILTK